MAKALQSVPLSDVTHDEVARQNFVLGLKTHISREVGPGNKKIYERRVLPEFRRRTNRDPNDRAELRHAMERDPYHQAWGSLMRTAQELMWDSVEDTVDRQLPELMRKTKSRKSDLGTVRVDPELAIPSYITAVDTHCMPGSYYSEVGEDDIRQGAVYDRGVSIYHLSSRGALHDLIGRSIVALVNGTYPDLNPKRILDMGCSIGQVSATLAEFFPDAEVHGIDLGAPMVRYAHGRAEALGQAVHFSQQNAEHTDFEDGSFDLIISHIMLHETSAKAAPNILKESRRLLRNGGVMAHVEVPVRYKDLPIYDQVMRGWQTYYNAEPFWNAVCSMDLVASAKAAGFEGAHDGYFKVSNDPIEDTRSIIQTPNQGQDHRYVLTAMK